MLNQESMSVLQSIMISGLGMLVVVAELSVLAIAIKLFTGLLSIFGKEEAANKPVKTNSESDGNFAVVLAVVNEELNSEDEKYKITSVREI